MRKPHRASPVGKDFVRTGLAFDIPPNTEKRGENTFALANDHLLMPQRRKYSQIQERPLRAQAAAGLIVAFTFSHVA
jgi:hypothetical protein